MCLYLQEARRQKEEELEAMKQQLDTLSKHVSSMESDISTYLSQQGQVRAFIVS